MVIHMLIIGHLCIDEKIIDNRRVPLQLGSSVAYASIASVKNNYKNGLKTKVISKIGYDFPDSFLNFLKNNNVPIDYIYKVNCKSTRYKLIYEKDERIALKLENICEKIKREDIPIQLIKESNIIYFALIANEIDFSAIEWIKINFPDKLICLDIQGILRFKKEDKGIYLAKNDQIIKLLKSIDIIKMADYEAKILINSDNLKNIAKLTSNLGPKIVIITCGFKGSLIYDSKNNCYYTIPAVIPKKIIDITGTGDTYFSSFLSEYYKTNNLKHSGLYAATFVSFLIQQEGLKGMPIREQVIDKMNELGFL